MTDNNVDLKELLREREKSYLEYTQKILEVFLPQLNESIQTVIYENNPVDILIKGVYPITDNLNYVSIVAKVSEMSIGDTVPIIDENSNSSKQIKITKDNYWALADTLTLKAPISVLETQDTSVIAEFVSEVYENEMDLPVQEDLYGNNLDDLTDVSDDSGNGDFDDSGLDKAQQELLDLYNNNGSKH